MKITLILAAAPNDPLRENDPFMPLSLPLLAASAPGNDYTFVDMLAGEEPDFDAPADLVGVSARLTAERTAYRIADEYRRRGVKVVLGGPQISSVPHRAAEHADAVAVGEGELLWPVITGHAAAGKELERFYVASPREFDGGGLSVHRLDSYLDLAGAPSPIEARSLYRKKYVFDTVYAARGCAVDCDFCSVPYLFGKKTRLRPVDDVVREIESFKGFYYLLDDTVFGRPRTHDYYAELYDRIAALPGEARLWTGQANLDAAATPEGREVIRKAARAGFLYAMIGMESIDPAVLAKAGTIRKMGVKGAEDAAARMKEHIAFIQDQGIAISGWFTIGYEEDSMETFERNLAFCEETKIIPILCPLEALPGTRLHERLSAEGRVDEQKKINTVHPTMTDEDILAAMRSTTRRGFSLGRIWERTRFYWKKFALDPDGNKVHPKLRFQKSTFIWVLQHKLKKGVIGLANAE